VNSSAISVTNLVKTFSSPRWRGAPGQASCVLDGVNLDVSPSEIVGLLGSNGAGKTTLVEILATHLLPTSGVARICGQDVVAQAQAVRHLVGYAPSSTDTFFPRLSIQQNLEFFATLYDLNGATAERRVCDLIELVGLGDVKSRSFQKLSLGMQQRLSIARALLVNPPVLLLDEPTRSLDPAMQRAIHRLLRETLRNQQGKAILLVTHSFLEAETVCDRIAILSRGRLAACGKIGELLSGSGISDLPTAFERLTGHDIAAPEISEPGSAEGQA